MTENTIRVGIVGAGANTRARHIPGLQALEGVELIGVVNRSPESSRRAADEFRIPKIYPTWQDLIADDTIDAVVIGTWPYLHCPATVMALERGKHVLCEARMAATAQEAHAMLNASLRRPDLIAQLVPAPFTLRVDKTIRRLIAEGFLGRLLAVEIRAGGNFLEPGTPLHWRQDYSLSGVNVMSLGIWYESLLRWTDPAVRVTARGKIFIPKRKDQTGRFVPVQIPDHIDVIADLAGGAQAHIQISNVTSLAGPPEVFLFGADGTIRVTEDNLYGGRRGDGELKEIPIPPHEEGRWRVEEEFVNAIRGKEHVTHTTFADGVKYMEFTEAAVRAMAEEKTITLPLN